MAFGIIDCLLKKAELGTVTRKQADKVKKLVEDLTDQQRAGTDVDKELTAAKQAFELMDRKVKKRLQQVALHQDMLETNLKRIKENPDVPVDVVLKSMNFGDEALSYKFKFLGENTHNRVNFWTNMYTAKAMDILDNINPKTMGVLQSRQRSKEVIQDLYASLRGIGKRSDDPIVRKIGDKFSKLVQDGADDFDRAGGAIVARKDYPLGMLPDKDKILKFKQKEFIDDTLEIIDLESLSVASGGHLKTTEQFRIAIREYYYGLTTGGINRLPDFFPKGLKSVANKRNHHRLFQPKDADAYITWHEKYGDINVYQQAVSYAKKLGRDMGVLEVYGPKPEAMLNNMLKESAGRLGGQAKTVEQIVRRQFMGITGSYDRTADPKVAQVLGAFRSLTTAAKLGGGGVIDAAIADGLALTTVATKLRGVPTLKVMARNFKQVFKPGLPEDIREVAKLGYMVEAYIDESLFGLRQAQVEGTHKWSSRAASAVLKFSFNNRLANSAKVAAVREFSLGMAEKSWKEMPNNFRRWSKVNGVDEKMYNLIKEHGTIKSEHWGIDVIDPITLAEKGFVDEASTLVRMSTQFHESVSPQISPKLKNYFDAIEKESVASQFVVGSSRQFTGYLGSFYENVVRTIWHQQRPKDVITYGAGLFLGLTTLNMFSTMARDFVMQGKTTEFNEELLLRAMSRAFPIIGDIIIGRGGNGPGTGIFDSLGGSQSQSVGDAVNAIQKGVRGDFTGAGQDIVKVLTDLLPGGNIWYTSLLMKRAIRDQIDQLTNPKADQRVRRKIARARKKGSTYWWKPGSILPKILK